MWVGQPPTKLAQNVSQVRQTQRQESVSLKCTQPFGNSRFSRPAVQKGLPGSATQQIQLGGRAVTAPERYFCCSY